MPLPAITVTAPSPVAPPAASAPQWPAGILPVVTGAFAPVTVIPGFEIDSANAATLGDLMFARPGLTASTFAPGASRPVIRGLDNFRVRIQENGIGAHDLSDLGEDHGVPIDPLSADRMEVIRGPATLRYGSQAIGGVVSIDNNRIPTAPLENGFNARFKGAATSADRGYESAGLIEAGGRHFVMHADAFERRAQDYAIPGGGRQANSWVNAKGHAIGGSFVSDSGFIGASVSRHLSRYGIPGIESAQNGTLIDLDQIKLNARGELQLGSGFIDTIRFWYGATQYQHDELARETGPLAIASTFSNRQQEGRVEFQHMPVGPWRGAFGAQYGHQRIATQGEAEEFLLPAQMRNLAAYLFEELTLAPGTKFQVAGRIESAKAQGTAGLFPAGLLPANADEDDDDDHAHGTLPQQAATRRFLPASVSAGVIQDLPFGLTASLIGQYVERAPAVPELFAKGAHHASETFEIGNPDLRKEKASTLEFGLRRAQGPLRFDATAYHSRYRDFIYKRLTGNTCGHHFDDCAPGDGGELDQVVYAQRDAVFRGIEMMAQLDLLPVLGGMFGIDGQYDRVDARFSDGTFVPRIPPQRYGGGAYWRHENWHARIGMLRADVQTRVAPEETMTGGYDLLKAELTYTTKLRPSDFGAREFAAGISGDNLLDDDVRNHVSFRKDEVLLPGRRIKVFANLRF